MRNICLTGFVAIAIIVSMLFVGCGEKPDNGSKKNVVKTENNTIKPSTKSNSSVYGDTVLKLGRIPFTNSSAMVHKHNKLLAYLTEKLGVKQTRLRTAANYQSILNQLIRGKIDIAWLGSQSSVEARKNPEVELLVKPVRFGTTSYRGIIIARQDSGIRSLEDLKGKKFAWVDKESASGYLFPKSLLIEAGIDPDRDFETAQFLGKHDAVVLNVLLGKYDAGACYDDARKTLRDEKKREELTILATTQDISNEPIVCRKSLPEDLRAKIKKAFLDLSLKTPEGKIVLKDLTDVQGFVPANPRDYDYIKKVEDILKKHNTKK